MPNKIVQINDGSHWRWPTDLNDVIAVGSQGWITKATEGTTWVDDYYDDWQIQAESLDLPFGSFHYWRAGYDAQRQAQHYFNIATARGKPLFPPIIDVEKTNNIGVLSFSAASAHLKLVCLETEALWGEKPWIYSSYYGIKDMFGAPSWMAEYPLWVASYRPDTPLIPVPWQNNPEPKYIFWQDTSSYKIPGTVFAGYDRDWWHGTQAQYDNYIAARKAIISPPPPPAPFPFMGTVQLPANLNIFNTPMGEKIGLLPHETAVTILEEVKDAEGIRWYKLGGEAYVKAKYIIPME